jgi:hypothetical protein
LEEEKKINKVEKETRMWVKIAAQALRLGLLPTTAGSQRVPQGYHAPKAKATAA